MDLQNTMFYRAICECMVMSGGFTQEFTFENRSIESFEAMLAGASPVLFRVAQLFTRGIGMQR
jgi:hypothetical protein